MIVETINKSMETTHNSSARYVDPQNGGNVRSGHMTSLSLWFATRVPRCFPPSRSVNYWYGGATQAARGRTIKPKQLTATYLCCLPHFVDSGRQHESSKTCKGIPRPHLPDLWHINEKPLGNARHDPPRSGNLRGLCLRPKGIFGMASRQLAGTHRRCQITGRPDDGQTPGTNFARSRYVNPIRRKSPDFLDFRSYSKHYVNYPVRSAVKKTYHLLSMSDHDRPRHTNKEQPCS